MRVRYAERVRRSRLYARFGERLKGMDHMVIMSILSRVYTMQVTRSGVDIAQLTNDVSPEFVSYPTALRYIQRMISDGMLLKAERGSKSPRIALTDVAFDLVGEMVELSHSLMVTAGYVDHAGEDCGLDDFFVLLIRKSVIVAAINTASALGIESEKIAGQELSNYVADDILEAVAASLQAIRHGGVHSGLGGVRWRDGTMMRCRVTLTMERHTDGRSVIRAAFIPASTLC